MFNVCNQKAFEGLSSIFINNVRRERMSLDEIVKEVSIATQISVYHIKKNRHFREYSDARKMLVYIARKHTNHKLAKIGLFLARNHATIIYNYEAAEDLLKTNKTFRTRYFKIIKNLNVLSYE